MSCRKICEEFMKIGLDDNVEECVKNCRKGLRELLGTDDERQIEKIIVDALKKIQRY